MPNMTTCHIFIFVNLVLIPETADKSSFSAFRPSWKSFLPKIENSGHRLYCSSISDRKYPRNQGILDIWLPKKIV